jgi:hypothetical protein
MASGVQHGVRVVVEDVVVVVIEIGVERLEPLGP